MRSGREDRREEDQLRAAPAGGGYLACIMGGGGANSAVDCLAAARLDFGGEVNAIDPKGCLPARHQQDKAAPLRQRPHPA